MIPGPPHQRRTRKLLVAGGSRYQEIKRKALVASSRITITERQALSGERERERGRQSKFDSAFLRYDTTLLNGWTCSITVFGWSKQDREGTSTGGRSI